MSHLLFRSLCLILSFFYNEWCVESITLTLYNRPPMKWNEANQFCQNMGQSLIKLESSTAETSFRNSISSAFTSGLTSPIMVWIGLHSPDPNNLADRKWAADCSFPVYQNFYPGKNTGQCVYVQLSSNAVYWYSTNCDTDTNVFVCQQKSTTSSDLSTVQASVDTQTQTVPSFDACGRTAVSMCSECVTTIPTSTHDTTKRSTETKEPTTARSPSESTEATSTEYATTIQTSTEDIKHTSTEPTTARSPSESTEATSTEYATTIQTSTEDIKHTSLEPTTARSPSESTEATSTEYATTIQTSTEDIKHTSLEPTTARSPSESTEATSTEYATTIQTSTEDIKHTSTEPTTARSPSESTEATSTELVTTIQISTQDMMHTSTESTVSTPSMLNKATSTEHVTTIHTEDMMHTSTESTETTTVPAPSEASSTTSVVSSKGNLPYCECTCVNVTTILTLEESIKQIVDSIKVDIKNTSTYFRNRRSAHDNRKSSAYIGYFGVTIIATVIGVIVYLDIQLGINKCCMKNCKNRLK